MANQFRFPIGGVNGSSIARTYASVIQSITNRITTEANAENRMVQGRPICPPGGYFMITLYPRPDSELAPEDRRGKVRLLFSYQNLYLQAFESDGVWYPYSDVNLPQHIQGQGEVHQLPFSSAYYHAGMGIDFSTLRFGYETVVDIYRTLSRHPNNPGGMPHLKEILGKCCILFSEAMRFPWLKKFLVWLMGGDSTEKLGLWYQHFNNWGRYCTAIRSGAPAFRPMHNPDVHTFEELLSIVGLLLSIG